ncbi:hypothetical protein TWF694_005670 [Orbilia ellipsospora]|uniref:Uncharacterized protein n=1 Tax=Orbilia ellipsospora TaxID=2528407 RepID=A0AAV9WU49_9PEZI
MVNILSSVVAVLSTAVAVQSAALPEFISADRFDKRSPNPNPLVPGSSGGAIIGRRHYISDGVNLIETRDPAKDVTAAALHKRYASRVRFLNCTFFGQNICGTCFYHDVSYDTATCIPTPVPNPTLYFVVEEMTNAYMTLYYTPNCTGHGFEISGCKTYGCNTTGGAGGTQSVLAQVGCGPALSHPVSA